MEVIIRDDVLEGVKDPVPYSERLEQIRQEAIVNHLPMYRYAKEISGITANGVPIQTDRESRSILTGAYVRAKEDSAYTVKWKTPAGFVSLTSAQIIAISDAVAKHVEKCYSAEASVYSDILSMTSKEDVETAFDRFYAA